MTSLNNPWPVFSFRWWIHEGGICEEDGHPDAARAAYGQAAGAATSKDELMFAVMLRNGL